MTYGRAYHTASILSDGKVLVVGGDNGKTLNSSELYDPSTGKWTPTGSMYGVRSIHRISVLRNGKVLAFAELNSDAYLETLTSTELYDPSTGN